MTAPGSFGHHRHPLLGRTVEDTATGRTGTLRAVMDTQLIGNHGTRTVKLAYVLPPGGGVEWTTEPGNIKAAS
ncbi:hypothetical protein [Streptacidiphilus anmyonensis]|uniref:hypothetical protein n=1 Tax=Streptacidiphilus anmyonensis TaxID=405782 RepID=UPI0005AB219F|nr:hypothetical protein [Streptacidiphilus anmyonensis]